MLKSPSWELTTKHDSDRYLHIVAFVSHQYYKLQDHLVDVLLNSTRSIENAARKEHKELCYEQRSKKNHSLAQIIDTVEELLQGYVEIDSMAHRKGQISERKIDVLNYFAVCFLSTRALIVARSAALCSGETYPDYAVELWWGLERFFLKGV